jgi:hypothetical protein
MDYLPLIEGCVDFFRHHQNEAGAIIDPFAHSEIQYSTPAFSLAAAILVDQRGRQDLLSPAALAFDFSLHALANGTTANQHADFYIPMLMHAHRILAGRVPGAEAGAWADLLRALVPEHTYRDTGGGGNWNLVNVSGEFLRRKDGLVAPDQRDAQMAYLERCLQKQQAAFTRFGMYEDPYSPLAYDAFPRLWLEDAMDDDAFESPLRQSVLEWLTLGGLSTLLLLSPSGEWACGGRSSNHQWNEAEVAVIAEVNARRWKAAGRQDVAGAFKRAAHLALTSMRRWRRPTGELWIVKNFASPVERFGYEGYSFFSQYNLLPMAMLAIAYSHADDSIPEHPLPGEAGQYVFDIRDRFHKVCAAAGGYYALIDTGADPHYNSTGLLRVHRAGVSLPPYSNNPCAQRAYGPPAVPTRLALTPGIAWQDAEDGPWHSLADFGRPEGGSHAADPHVGSADLDAIDEPADHAHFTVTYNLVGEGARLVHEDYRVSRDGVQVGTWIEGEAPAHARVILPILVSDGARDTNVHLEAGRVVVRREGGTLTWEVLSPAGLNFTLDGPRVPMHNGWIQAATAELPAGAREVRWVMRLDA